VTDNAPNQQAPEPEVISRQWLDAMLPSREAFVRRLFTVFIQEEPKRVASIKDALDRQDLERIRYLAHSLKGAAATIGCEQVRRTCLDLEKSAATKDLHRARELLSQLESEMECVYDRMKELLDQMNRDPAATD
jgi:HPt (histidine-containing phosphotransfer) domain-containing protein